MQWALWAAVCLLDHPFDQQFNEAAKHFRDRQWARAAAVAAPLTDDPDPLHQAQAHHLLAGILQQTGQHARSARHYEKALELWPANHPARAATLMDFGYLRLGEHRLAEAQSLLEQALVRHEASGDASRIAINLARLADVWLARHEPDRAQPLLERTRRLLPPGSPDWLSTTLTLSRLHALAARDREALALLDEADKHCASPLDCGGALAERGGLYRLRNEAARARPILRRAASLLESALGPNDRALASLWFDLALVDMLEGKLQAAGEKLTRAETIMRATLPPDHPAFSLLELHRARLCLARGAFGEAAALMQRALPRLEDDYPPDHPEVVAARLVTAAAVASQDHLDDALAHYEQVRPLVGGKAAREYLRPFQQPGKSPEAQRLGRFLKSLR